MKLREKYNDWLIKRHYTTFRFKTQQKAISKKISEIFSTIFIIFPFGLLLYIIYVSLNSISRTTSNIEKRLYYFYGITAIEFLVLFSIFLLYGLMCLNLNYKFFEPFDLYKIIKENKFNLKSKIKLESGEFVLINKKEFTFSSGKRLNKFFLYMISFPWIILGSTILVYINNFEFSQNIKNTFLTFGLLSIVFGIILIIVSYFIKIKGMDWSLNRKNEINFHLKFTNDSHVTLEENLTISNLNQIKISEFSYKDKYPDSKSQKAHNFKLFKIEIAFPDSVNKKYPKFFDFPSYLITVNNLKELDQFRDLFSAWLNL